MTVVRAAYVDEATDKLDASLLPATAATVSALNTVSSTATTAATNAATALSTANTAATNASTALGTANTAASDAAAAAAAVAGKLNATGTKTVTGATEFSTTPTVAAVPVATQDDLDDYVPTTQAATFVNGLDVDGTGTVTISAGGKDFVFTYLANVLQGGMVDDGVDPAVEGLIELRYDGTHLPTTAQTDLWPSTKPASGGPIIQWAASPGATESTYEADAFGTGVHGWRAWTDSMSVTLPSAWSPEPGTGRGLIAMSIRDVMVTTGTTNVRIIRFMGASGTLQRFGFFLRNDGGTLKWVADSAVAATQTVGTYDGEIAITDKMVFAVELKGADSQIHIATAAGTQTLPVDLAGVLSYDVLDFTPYIDGVNTGAYTVHEIIAGPDGFTTGNITSALQSLAENVGFAIGA